MTLTYRQPFKGDYIITQLFGEKITDPEGHTGIDYGCPFKTEILASADGEVIFAGWDQTGYGNLVMIRHTDGNATMYAHLQEIRVQCGQVVKQSEIIGLSGWTGTVIPAGPGGAHLHFEARGKDGKPFDPMALPLMTVDDSVQPAPDTEQEAKPVIPVGVCQIVCDSAFVRDWETIQRQHLIYKGERLYAFADVKLCNGLPYRFIGAGMCVAEYDAYGTQILGTVE